MSPANAGYDVATEILFPEAASRAWPPANPVITPVNQAEFTGSAPQSGGARSYSGAALSPRALDSFEASDATTMTTAISPITSVQIALISGCTPSRTSE